MIGGSIVVVCVYVRAASGPCGGSAGRDGDGGGAIVRTWTGDDDDDGDGDGDPCLCVPAVAASSGWWPSRCYY